MPRKSKPNPDAKTFGGRIQIARETAQLSQDALGKLVGLSGRQISHLETGRRKETPKLNLIARATGCSIPWLEHGTGEPNFQTPSDQDTISLYLELDPRAQKAVDALVLQLSQQSD